jgi:hypothetical protein
MKNRMAGALAGVLIFLGSPVVPAQSTAGNPLAKVKTLTCTFEVYTSAKWKNGTPEAEIKNARMSLEIDEIDTDSGTARLAGTSGPAYVTALLTVSSLHFMERSVTGTLDVTTIFVPEAAGQKLRAVHSRHDYLPMSIPGFVSQPTVSQNYGSCEATR